MIKKSYLTFAFLLSFIVISKAQFGVRAGLNFASTKFEVLGLNADTDSKVGFHVGLVNDFSLSEKLTFRPGVLFSLKGGKTDESSSTYTYIDVPLSLVYNFTEAEKGFFLEAGPYVGLLLAAKNEDDDIKEGFNTLDFGLNIGLGYDLGSFILGANYGFGLANIAKEEDGADITAKNANISIYGIYQF
jgi:hypothetical protein